MTATLTARQLQIAALVAQGLRNKEIAAELGIAVGTVKVQLKQIYLRLDLKGRVRVANWYRDRSEGAR